MTPNSDESEKRRFVVETDKETHERLKKTASYFGASVRGTVVRYIIEGLARDAQGRALEGPGARPL